MAQRRMFSNRIANSARFLQMPAESQLLYFHMILRADDDGIVEAYPLIKLLGMPPDNMKVLLAKGMIKQLNEDQVVVIMDWTEHNQIRADRKINSIYLPLLIRKYPELPIIEPKPRSDVEDNSQRLGGQSTDGIGKVRLGKVRLSKVTLATETVAGLNSLIELFKEINPSYERIYPNKTERAALTRLVKKFGEKSVRGMIEALPGIVSRPYAPKVTKPSELERDMGKLKIFMQQERSKGVGNKIGIAL